MTEDETNALFDASIGAECTVCKDTITEDDARREGVHMDYDPRWDETPAYRHGGCDPRSRCESGECEGCDHCDVSPR